MTSDRAVIVAVDEDATEKAGISLAADLRGGDVILLEGPLAAGKTTLVRGMVDGLRGDRSDVSSPTFVLVQTYPCAGSIPAVHHVDLYRLPKDPAALREVGIEEILADERAVIAVEWPRELLAEWLPNGCRVWRVVISHLDDDARRIEVDAPATSSPPS